MGNIEKQFDQKEKVNFKYYDATAWETAKCNLHIAQYPTSKGNQTMKFAQLIEYNIKNHTQNGVERLFSDSFRKNKN